MNFAQASPRPLIVDFHAYFQPESFLKRLRARSAYPRIEQTPQGEAIFSGPEARRPLKPEQTDIEHRVRGLAAAGIDCQILRLQNVSGVDALDPAEGLEVAQAANEELADLAKKYPGRFIPYAAVPLTDVKNSVLEMQRAVTKLGHRGVGLSVHVNGKPIDHPDLVPLLECAAKLRVPVILLPNHPSMIDAVLEPHGWLTGAFGFQVDISTVALRLICGGALQKLGNLKIVLANLGGVVPFVMERLDQYWSRTYAGARPIAQSPRDALRRFWYETASGHPAAIRMTAEVLGADRFVFGSDYPSFDFARGLRSVRESGLPAADIERILRGNARDVLAP